MTVQLASTVSVLRRFVIASRPPRLRTMTQFAIEEIRIPSGPLEGRDFRLDTQPWAKLLLAEIDSGHWDEIVGVGPTQSGKTLVLCMIPLLYHLFELGETVIFGVPDLAMAADKWREDIVPIIERTRYRDLIPRVGGGSRGGVPLAIQFTNGATLRFMGGGGGDKQRAAFTARVIIITEADGLDEPGLKSRESSKIQQIKARARAFGHKQGMPSRIYSECTVSVEAGYVWSTRKAGSESRIALPCPHCDAFVTPERENLVGWQQAKHELEAEAVASFACPACGECWDEDDRYGANLRGRVLHRGQDIGEDGEIVGNEPQTRLLGFRWSAPNNMFVTAGQLGAREWRAQRATDQDGADRELCQFDFAIPPKEKEGPERPLDYDALTKRTAGLPRGQVPEETHRISVGIDIGKWVCWYTVLASRSDSTADIIDYGSFTVPSEDNPMDEALLSALRTFRDQLYLGYAHGSGPRQPDCVFIDARYQSDDDAKTPIYTFVRESNQALGWEMFWPTMGQGYTQARRMSYSHPMNRSRYIRAIGDRYYLRWMRDDRINVIHIDVDHWKTIVHDRMRVDPDATGAFRLFHAGRNEHNTYLRHLTSEQKIEEWVGGRPVTRWVRVGGRQVNHYLDTLVLAACGAHWCGVRLIRDPDDETEDETGTPTPALIPETLPDGRTYSILDR